MTTKQRNALDKVVINAIAAILQASVRTTNNLNIGSNLAIEFDAFTGRTIIHTGVSSINQYEQVVIQDIVGLTDGITFSIVLEGDHLDIAIGPVTED